MTTNGSPTDAQGDSRAILRGAGLALAGFLIRPLSRVPFLLIVGRIYGQSEFGRYVFAVGLFEALAAFCRLGLKDTLFRFLAENPREQEAVVIEALVVGVGLSALCASIVLVVAPFAGAALASAPMWRMLGLLAPVLPVFVATDILFAAVRYHRALGYEIIGRSIVEPMMVTLGALAFGMAGFGAPGLLIAYAAAQLVTLGVAGVGVARRFAWASRPTLARGRLSSMAAQSAPTGFADCVGLGFNATGIILIGHLLGEAALGVYGMAQNLETALSKVRQAFDMIVIPVVSRGLAEQGDGYVVDQLRMIGRSILTAQLPLLAACLLFGADILGLFGKGFETGAALLALMALAAVIDGVVNLAQVPLFMRRPKANLALALSALAINLGLGMLLIPRLGVAGVGVAMVVALTVAGAGRQWLAARAFGGRLLTGALWRPFAAITGAAGLSMLALRLGPPTPAGHAAAALVLALGYVALLGLVDPQLRRRALAWAKTRRAGAAV